MKIPKPEHYFEQAERLAKPRSAGAPRQVDLRRAVSAAYYGLFHAILGMAADQFVCVRARNTPLYVLAYRSIEHSRVREICGYARHRILPDRLVAYGPPSGFSSELRDFADAAIGLQELRHDADYNPSVQLVGSDVRAAVDLARRSLEQFTRADVAERRAFLGLLLFRMR